MIKRIQIKSSEENIEIEISDKGITIWHFDDFMRAKSFDYYLKQPK